MPIRRIRELHESQQTTLCSHFGRSQPESVRVNHLKTTFFRLSGTPLRKLCNSKRANAYLGNAAKTLNFRGVSARLHFFCNKIANGC